MLQDRSVLVTGAGGTIGSELCRLIGRWSPKRLVLLEANEFALYEIERKLLPLCSFPIVATLGSITDGPLIERTLRANEVDVVFHAAAHKHVPMLEANVLEGIRNNVFGTQVMAEAALAQGVSSFVLISSDKAVRPTSVMGATKRWAELIVRACGERPEALNKGLRFCGVRFGNVLGSNGSVVPLFREQIAAGGPVTLTDGRMTRYFMSIHEAAELIVQAGALSEGGDIFLLEMGEPVRIRDLAENMIRLAGFSVRNGEDGDIEIHETGIRPGEKLFEELFYDPSKVTRTRQPKIMRARRGELDREELDTALVRLSEAVERQDEACARAVLFGLIQK
jgi:FlaA1/EpsC-like NDP-sugar epimerase